MIELGVIWVTVAIALGCGLWSWLHRSMDPRGLAQLLGRWAHDPVRMIKICHAEERSPFLRALAAGLVAATRTVNRALDDGLDAHESARRTRQELDDQFASGFPREMQRVSRDRALAIAGVVAGAAALFVAATAQRPVAALAYLGAAAGAIVSGWAWQGHRRLRRDGGAELAALSERLARGVLLASGRGQLTQPDVAGEVEVPSREAPAREVPAGSGGEPGLIDLVALHGPISAPPPTPIVPLTAFEPDASRSGPDAGPRLLDLRDGRCPLCAATDVHRRAATADGLIPWVCEGCGYVQLFAADRSRSGR